MTPEDHGGQRAEGSGDPESSWAPPPNPTLTTLSHSVPLTGQGTLSPQSCGLLGNPSLGTQYPPPEVSQSCTWSMFLGSARDMCQG